MFQAALCACNLYFSVLLSLLLLLFLGGGEGEGLSRGRVTTHPSPGRPVVSVQ